MPPSVPLAGVHGGAVRYASGRSPFRGHSPGLLSGTSAPARLARPPAVPRSSLYPPAAPAVHGQHAAPVRTPSPAVPGAGRPMLRAAVMSAFFGLLRSSEHCAPSPTEFDLAVHLLAGDVAFDSVDGMVQLRIKASKTDPFLGLHPALHGPLFAILRAAFSSSCGLNTHSFRIGGASAAGVLGMSASMIRALGRWMGDSCQRYVQLQEKYVFHAQLRMLKFAE